jgi:hypothetical protein
MKYIITNSGNILVVIRGYTYSVSRSHPQYDRIHTTIQKPTITESTLIELIEFKEACKEFGVSLDERGISVDGEFDANGQDALDQGVSVGNIALRKALESL